MSDDLPKNAAPKGWLADAANTITISLTLSAIGGVVFIAYQNPESYKKIATILTNAVMTLYALAGLWSIILSTLSTRLRRRLGYAKAEAACAELDRLTPPLGWSFLTMAAIVVFLLILRFIPNAKSP